jgi:alpha-mannosidase
MKLPILSLLMASAGYLTGAALPAETQETKLVAVHAPPVLVERDGQLRQIVSLTFSPRGEATTARLSVEGTDPVTVSLSARATNFEVAVPAVAQAKTARVTVEVGGQTMTASSVTLKPVRHWVVYLLPHSHVDIGYTHLQSDVEKAQWKYLEMGMDAARKSAGNPAGARFKWNVEVLWAVDSYLRQATPDQQQAFFAAVKAGQIGLEALYGNELTGLCQPEELMRLVGFAQKLSQRCGMPIESAMITDVPGYTWGMVPVFAQSGIKYWSVGPNGGDRIGHTTAAWGDKPFWWIGPNGKDRVLVWMTGTGYYQVFKSTQKLLDYLDQLEAKNYAYDLVQVRHCLGDNGAPDVDFSDKVKEWNSTHAFPRLVIATADDMFHDFEKRYGDQIPTARGDFTPYWEDGAASSARETALNRASADRLLQAETVYAMFNPKAYPAEEFYQAWRNVILYDEHTWGAHNSISQPDAPFVKSQWAVKQAFALRADEQSRKLLEAANDQRGPKPPGIAGKKMDVIDVINTTASSNPWTLVVVPKQLSTAGDCVMLSATNTTGRISQRLTTGELVFRPCFGSYLSQRYYIADHPPAQSAFTGAHAEGVTLSSDHSAVARGLTVRLDATSGAIASLIYQGHECVDTNASTQLNDYFYLPGNNLKAVRRNGPVKISVKEKGPLIASLQVESEAPGCRRLIREYRLHALRNYLEIIDTVDKEAVRAKEGVHLGFGFHIPDGTMRLDVPWGVVRPEIDQIPGACKNWLTVQRWVDISNQQYGMTWLSLDAPLIEIGGLTADRIGALSNPKAWLDHLEPSTTLYSWIMNNHWHTNYRAEQEGPNVFRFYLWPHDGAYAESDAARLAQECSQPILVFPARGETPPGSALTSVTGAQVTCFKPSEDGQAWIIRLFGTSAKTENVKLGWRDPQPTVTWLSDNSERPLRRIQDTVEVAPQDIVTVRADLPSQGVSPHY